jgi:hypothetical protein
MIDKLGNELQIGDKVLSSKKDGYLEKAVIVSIDQVLYGHGPYSFIVKYVTNRTARKYPNQLIKVEW